jgi:GntR family transcriptional regulator, rspAB operon transcriptional repressor
MSEIADIPSLPLADLLAQEEVLADGNMTSRIYTLLRKLIIEVKLIPGRALSEKEIAATLNVSKTPVREAIIRLADEGLLKVVPKGGTYVAPIEMQRYLEACFIRFRLEEGAVGEAALRHTFEDIIQLEACISEQVAAGQAEDFERFFQLDEEFHQLIFSAARLAGAWAVVNQAKGEIDRIRHLKRIVAVRRIDKVVADHRDIVTAIRSADPWAAQDAMRNHIGSLEAKIEELASDPKLLKYIEQMNTRSTRKRAPKRAAAE